MHCNSAMPSRRLWGRCIVLLAATIASAAFAAAGQAAPKTLAECVEGSEFVANAARSRDNGMTSEAFLARLDDDLVAIRAFPPALRWFAQDEDDERMLRHAAHEVFERPQAPERHAGAFLAACIDSARA